MRRLILSLTCLATLAAGPAACGEDEAETKTFDERGFDITFDYPGDFKVRDDVSVSGTSGGSAQERTALALDDENLLVVEKYELNIAVTEDNLDQIKRELDGVVEQATGKEAEGRKTEVGGLPGYEYTVGLSKPEKGESRLVFLFRDKVEYELNCQSTPEKREQIQEACDQALETLKERG